MALIKTKIGQGQVASGRQIGSNYDPTGNNTQGRVTVVFRGNWAQATDIADERAGNL